MRVAKDGWLRSFVSFLTGVAIGLAILSWANSTDDRLTALEDRVNGLDARFQRLLDITASGFEKLLNSPEQKPADDRDDDSAR